MTVPVVKQPEAELVHGMVGWTDGNTPIGGIGSRTAKSILSIFQERPILKNSTVQVALASEAICEYGKTRNITGMLLFAPSLSSMGSDCRAILSINCGFMCPLFLFGELFNQ